VFQTKGDANDDPDPTAVPESNLLGAVLLTIPFIGYVIQFANTPLGFVVLVGVPLGVLAITEIRSLSTEQRTASSTAESTAHSVANDTTAEADGTVPDKPTETMTTDTDRTTADESPTSADSQVNHRDEDSVATDTEPATVVIQPHDMTATIGLLVLIVPYSIYVAVQLQNTLTFSVMFGSTFLLIAAGWLWLAGRESVGTAVDTIQQTSTTSDLSSEQTATDSSIEEGD
jgi:signal peptidase